MRQWKLIKDTINKKEESFFINGDEGQLYRVFINLIKNSKESIDEKKLKIPNFKGKIHIDIKLNNDYILVQLIDNGNGIIDTNKIMWIKTFVNRWVLIFYLKI